MHTPVSAGAARNTTIPAFAVGGEDRLDWRRLVAAVARYKWLVMGVIVLGTAAGFGATRLVQPTYRTWANVWVEASVEGRGVTGGPIRPEQLLLEAEAWIDLLESYIVLDDVVRGMRLYLALNTPADSLAFASFQATDRLRPGEYRLAVDDTGRSFTLTAKGGRVVQHGTVGDSVGSAVGFAWLPSAQLLLPGRVIEFSVTTPREVAQHLRDQLTANISPKGYFLSVSLVGGDPDLIARMLNRILQRYVDVAADLKRVKLTELRRILADQLGSAERNLRNAEIALESFRVRTITLPAEPGTPVAPGLTMTQSPVLGRYFDMKIESEQVRQDREVIQRLLAARVDSGVPSDALIVIAAVQRSPELMQALDELTRKQAELRALRSRYTDSHPPVQRLRDDIQTLRRLTIPSLAARLGSELETRENELARRVRSASTELEQIPPRAIEEARLRRDVTIAENLYTTLQGRFEEARLAEASSIPDVRILDAAVAPRRPIKNTTARLLLVAVLGSLALGLAGAVLLDRVDPRLRYPEQVSQGMGLTILGVVPHVGVGKTDGNADSAPALEALRAIRLGVSCAYGTAGPLLVTITSPGGGDGKSFIASNLAVAFGESGSSTVLIDGDVRRGRLHRVLNASRKPGLTDYLAGHAALDEIVRATSYPGVSLVTCGTRDPKGPHLLGTAAMARFVTSLRTRYAVVLVDSPPLGAGVDAYLLGMVTGSILLVVRTGRTDRELTEAKLDVIDRLPIRILGAVVNDVQPLGPYRYYSNYMPEYEVRHESLRGDAQPLGRSPP